ncbi:hypothetical protein [uncultured Dysosmobacter sp.]|uniref:hypothetical protein n=1 Tax=uncultured Dysosmobacter sp. TaxID=2591384 RepID=UPI0026330681|nr:hypothetical protein [uncultured Dysosmobacter sp.]
MNIVTILMVLPLLVALTNMLTNVIKGLCGVFADHAKLIAPVVAVALTLAATAAYLEIFSVTATWYWYASGAVAGLVVAYVAMNGYDGLYEDLIKHLKGLAGGSNE